jgi:hypothetical protein
MFGIVSISMSILYLLGKGLTSPLPDDNHIRTILIEISLPTVVEASVVK